MHSLDTRLPQGIVKCTAADSNLDFFLIHYNFQSIHAGIYYPDASLKTRFCLRGKHLLYEFCHKHNVHHKRIGKWIVSQSPEQTQYLEKLKEKAAGLGVDLPWIASKEIQTKEPNLRVQAALDSPSTGIIDSHAYMKCLEHLISKDGLGHISLKSNVCDIQFRNGYYYIQVQDLSAVIESFYTIRSRVLVNSGGLHSNKLAAFFNLTHSPNKPNETYHLHYCKGHYVSYASPQFISRLIYPCPEKNLVGLGIHATLDMQGKLKFGPDTVYDDQGVIDYTMPSPESIEGQEILDKFYAAVKGYIPAIDRSKMMLDYSGVRPKLAGIGEPFRDFIVQEESARGFPRLINLIGIESPGLTSSLAIGEYVAELIAQMNE